MADIIPVDQPTTVVTSTSTPSPSAVPEATPTKKKWSLAEARGAIFNQKPKSVSLEFAGVPVRLQEPGYGEVMEANADEDRKRAMANMLVRYVYLDTDDGSIVKLFSEEDVDSILSLPFNDDIRSLSEALNKMLGVQPTAEDKSKPA